MHRLLIIPAVALAFVAVVAGCGSPDGSAIETLPPIKTTTSTTTTTTTPDSRRIFYEVKSGDTVGNIADSFEVTRALIVELNNLSNDGNDIDVGQVLEIPNDVRLVADLPTTTSTSTSVG
jgi:LysM repeat protein